MPKPPNPQSFAPDDAITDPLLWRTATNAPGVRDQLAQHLGEIARYSGGLILEAVACGFNTYCKPDGSNYTDADIAAERFILEALTAHFPNIPIIAEEQSAAQTEAGAASHLTPPGDTFFLVDPLDGTRGFTVGGLEYTVNIAAIVDNAPVAGAIYAPASGMLWIGGARAYVTTITSFASTPPLSAWRQIKTRPAPQEGLTALASQRHGDGRTGKFMTRLPIRERFSASSSVKFCMLAQGDADIYPRFGPTMEWDTAAGDAILRAAGGIVVDEKGHPLIYGRAQSGYVNGPFIAWGDATKSREFFDAC